MNSGFVKLMNLIILGLTFTSILDAEAPINPPSHADNQGLIVNISPIDLDDDLYNKVQKKIGPSWNRDGYPSVNIEVNQGVVTLSGTVDSWAEKDKVASDVRSIYGVKMVNNQITVRRYSQTK